MSEETMPLAESVQDEQEYPLDDVRSERAWREGYAAGRAADYRYPALSPYHLALYGWGWWAGYAQRQGSEARGVALNR